MSNVIARSVATWRSIWIAFRFPLLALAMTCSACAHKAELKTPSQIEAAQKKKDAKAAKESNHSPLITNH